MAEERFQPEESPELTALRKLVAEIAADDYRAKIGSPLTNNTAYLEARALLDLRDTLGTQRAGRN